MRFMASGGPEIPLVDVFKMDEVSSPGPSSVAPPIAPRKGSRRGKAVKATRRSRGRTTKKARDGPGDYQVVGVDDDEDASDTDLDDLEAAHLFTSTRKARRWRLRGIACGLIFLGILLALNLFYLITKQIYGDDDDDPDAIFRNWGRPGSGTEGLAWYPTDFLRDVVPIPCHSHNDYWRKVPLFSALHVGCIGVEADVWLHGQDLLVGHDVAALQPNRTFRSLYVDPLVRILERQNPATEYYNETRRGVFDTDPEQTVTLLVDIKTDGPATWPLVVEQLGPLRERNWLSTFDLGTVRRAPVTVVGTGNTPFQLVIDNSTHRDVFFDAPLDQLANSTFGSTNSYFASVSFRESIGTVWSGGLDSKQKARITDQLREAHARGLKARYWELPAWPIHIRNHIWDVLVQQGLDILNVDNLKDAARHDWTKAWGI